MTRKTKRIIISILAIVVVLVGTSLYLTISTKNHSPLAHATYDKDGLSIDIKYCQPFKKGRLIFGDEKDGALQPFGKYWRLGANEATTITTNKNVKFGGHSLEAGTYSLYAIPGVEFFTIAVNEVYDRWGYAEADVSKDIFRLNVPVEYTNASIEQLQINFIEKGDNALLKIGWDTTELKIEIE